MVFDRERNSWTGPWTNDARLFEVFYDANMMNIFYMEIDDSTLVDEYSHRLSDDKDRLFNDIENRLEEFWRLVAI